MPDLIDISVGLGEGVPVWPGSPGYRRRAVTSLAAGDGANGSAIDMDVHIGTHVDAPLHFLSDAPSVDALPLDVLVGPARVVTVPEGTRAIGPADLDALDIPEGTRRLLLRTSNSSLWDRGPHFEPDFAALSAAGAEWIVDHEIRLVGIDYLSIQRYHDDARTHVILLKAGVVILEGLNLTAAEDGTYELLCLPLSLPGAEAAPARAVLRPLATGSGT